MFVLPAKADSKNQCEPYFVRIPQLNTLRSLSAIVLTGQALSGRMLSCPAGSNFMQCYFSFSVRVYRISLFAPLHNR